MKSQCMGIEILIFMDQDDDLCGCILNQYLNKYRNYKLNYILELMCFTLLMEITCASLVF